MYSRPGNGNDPHKLCWLRRRSSSDESFQPLRNVITTPRVNNNVPRPMNPYPVYVPTFGITNISLAKDDKSSVNSADSLNHNIGKYVSFTFSRYLQQISTVEPL